MPSAISSMRVPDCAFVTPMMAPSFFGGPHYLSARRAARGFASELDVLAPTPGVVRLVPPVPGAERREGEERPGGPDVTRRQPELRFQPGEVREELHHVDVEQVIEERDLAQRPHRPCERGAPRGDDEEPRQHER